MMNIVISSPYQRRNSVRCYESAAPPDREDLVVSYQQDDKIRRGGGAA